VNRDLNLVKGIQRAKMEVFLSFEIKRINVKNIKGLEVI